MLLKKPKATAAMMAGAQLSMRMPFRKYGSAIKETALIAHKINQRVMKTPCVVCAASRRHHGLSM
jgi:hypothetical protein